MSDSAANAALGPLMGAYLAGLDQALQEIGVRVPVQVMTGAGGVVPAAEVAREPVAALMSGPVAGVVACQRLGQQLTAAGPLRASCLPSTSAAPASTSASSSAGSRSRAAEISVAGADISVLLDRRRLDRRRRRQHRRGRRSASCRSARAAPAPIRGRPATAAAAPSRPRPMPISCSACSIRRISSAAAWSSTSPRRERAIETTRSRDAARHERDGGGLGHPRKFSTAAWPTCCAA